MSNRKADRRAPRLKTDLETFFSSAREEGPAVLTDVSSGGARLEGTAVRPRFETRIRVSVFLPNQSTPMDLVGRVVRHTEKGFAVEFDQPQPEICRLIEDDVAAENAPEIPTPSEAPPLSDNQGGNSPAARRPDAERVREARAFVADAAIAARDGADADPEETLRSILERARRALESLEP